MLKRNRNKFNISEIIIILRLLKYLEFAYPNVVDFGSSGGGSLLVSVTDEVTTGGCVVSDMVLVYRRGTYWVITDIPSEFDAIENKLYEKITKYNTIGFTRFIIYIIFFFFLIYLFFCLYCPLLRFF